MIRNDLLELFAYTEWANALVLDAAAALPDAELRADRKISHGSILGTLAHMAFAEWLWLERWHGRAVTGPDAGKDWGPEGLPDVPALHARLRSVEADRRTLLAGLTDGELTTARTFQRLDGTHVTLPLGQQMQHVVNHATMHRGQVIGMLRQLGRKPPVTDLMVFFAQRPR